MNAGLLRVLLAHELRMVYRDGRTLVLSVVLPLLLVPLVLTALGMLNARRQNLEREATFLYVLSPPDPGLRALVRSVEKGTADPDAPPGSPRARQAVFQDATLTLDARQALAGGSIDLLVHYMPPGLTERTPDQESRPSPPGRRLPQARFRTARLLGAGEVQIEYVADRERSLTAMSILYDRLSDALTRARSHRLVRAGYPGDPGKMLEIESQDVASRSQLTGASLGPFLTLFLVLFLVGGGSVAALDTLAGEKERGTLETLLTTGAGRAEIIAAKQLATLVVALVIAGIQLLNSLLYLALGLVPLPQAFTLEATPELFGALALLILPLAGLVAGVLMLVSGASNGYKEAQILLFPTFAIMCLLSLTSLLPGLPLASAIALVPVANVSVALRDVLVGQFSWPWLLVTAGATTAWAAWLAARSAAMLQDEQLVLPGLNDEQLTRRSPAGFGREIWRCYGLLAVLVLLLNAGLGKHVTAEILVNQLVLFAGGAALMIRHYRLPWREALSWRPVRWPVWLAVLAFVPCSHLVSVAVSLGTGWLFPVPEAYLKQFSELLALESKPAWELYLTIALLPGICEEVAFRGLLLFGLKQRYGLRRKASIVVTVALVFGAFHFSLFRIPPTAFLGALLALICLWTGSLFPGILAHVGNNAMAVWASRSQIEMETMPWWTFLVAGLGTGVCLYVIYRCRTRERSPEP